MGVAFYSASTQDSRIEKKVTDSPNEFVPIDNTYGIELTGGKEMNKQGFTGDGIKVAVIDSGIDKNHSGFKDGKVEVVDFYNVTNNDDDLKSYFEDSLKFHGTHVAGTIQ